MTSRKSVTFLLTSIVIFRASDWNMPMMFFRILSTLQPGTLLRVARPSSRYNPIDGLSM